MYNRILMNIPESRRRFSYKIIRCICIATHPVTRDEIWMMINASDIQVEIHIQNLEHIIKSLSDRSQFIHLSLTNHPRKISLLPRFFNELLFIMEKGLINNHLESVLDLVLLTFPVFLLLILASNLLFYTSFAALTTTSYCRFGSLNRSRLFPFTECIRIHLKIRAFGFEAHKSHKKLFERCLLLWRCSERQDVTQNQVSATREHARISSARQIFMRLLDWTSI